MVRSLFRAGRKKAVERLHHVLDHVQIELAEARGLTDRLFVRRLREVRLRRHGDVEGLHAEKLLDMRGAVLESLLGIAGALAGQRLPAARQCAKALDSAA